ncbi:MAG: hypothetical protein K5858_05040 [Lachnospiraceae bacterium]|nr:hypothetical protein [Lachnospiraceae bacterium]
MANNILGGLYGSNSQSFDYSSYDMIKSGSYKKLVKAYYGTQKSSNENSVSKSELKAAAKKQTTMKQSANELASSAKALMNRNLYQPKEAEDGTKSVDRDSILEAAKNFVKSYNDTVDKAADSDSKSVLRNAVYMTQYTGKNKNLLSDVGIKVGADNKLTLDEEKLKSADVSKLQSAFTGSYGVIGSIATKASNIASAAGNSGATYTASAQAAPAVNQILAGSFDFRT